MRARETPSVFTRGGRVEERSAAARLGSFAGRFRFDAIWVPPRAARTVSSEAFATAGGTAGSVRGACRWGPAVGLPQEAPPLGSDLAARHGALRGLSVRDADRLAGCGYRWATRVPDTGRGLGLAFRGESGFGGDPPPRESPPGPGAWCEGDRAFVPVNRDRAAWRFHRGAAGKAKRSCSGEAQARFRESASPSRARRWLHRVNGIGSERNRLEGHGTGGAVLSQSARRPGIRRSCLAAVAARSHRLQRRRERAVRGTCAGLPAGRTRRLLLYHRRFPAATNSCGSRLRGNDI